MARAHYSRLNNKQRKDVRAYHRKTKLSIKEMLLWFKEKYGMELGKSTMSDMLSSKWDYLETSTKGDLLKRNDSSKWPVLDRLLDRWQSEQRKNGVAITDESIVRSGKQIWATLSPEGKVHAVTGKPLPNPSWSNGWLEKFKQRHNIVLRKINGKARTASKSAREEKMDRLRSIAQNYPKKNVYCVGESPLLWNREVSEETLYTSYSSLVPPGNRIFFTFCTNADGSDKLPLHLIGSTKTPVGFTEREIQTTEWEWKSNSVAWMTGDLFGEWLRKFYRHVGREKEVLLLVNESPAHSIGSSSAPPPQNITIEVLPPNPNNDIPSFDQNIITHTKTHYFIHLLGQNLRLIAKACQTKYTHASLARAITDVSLRNAVWWLHDAWKKGVDVETIQESFEKTTLFHANYQARSAPLPKIFLEIRDLYGKVADALCIEGVMPINEYVFPPSENVAPDFTLLNAPEENSTQRAVSENENASANNESMEEFENSDSTMETENNEFTEQTDNIEPLDQTGENGPTEETNRHQIELYKEGVKAAENLLHLSKDLDRSDPLLALRCRQMIEVLRDKIGPADSEFTPVAKKSIVVNAEARKLKQRTLGDFGRVCSGKVSTSNKHTASSFASSSTVNKSSYIDLTLGEASEDDDGSASKTSRILHG